MKYEVTIDGKAYQLELQRSQEQWACKLDGRELQVDAVVTGRDVLSLVIEGQVYEIKREPGHNDLHIWVGSDRYQAEVRDPRSLLARRGSRALSEGPASLKAPMPGKVVRLLALAGTEVEANQGVIVIEAMKMQNELKSPKKGTVKKVLVKEGDAVNAGDPLIVVE